MKNSFGNSITVSLFGESHGPEIGVVLDGLTPGLEINRDAIAHFLSKRRPTSLETTRKELDSYNILSGVVRGRTTGTPICITIPNEDAHSTDYNYGIARPSHADYTALAKYHGFEDENGGGHFSGRLTAALVAAGAILIPTLEKHGIYIGTHILSTGTINDRPFGLSEEEITERTKAETKKTSSTEAHLDTKEIQTEFSSKDSSTPQSSADSHTDKTSEDSKAPHFPLSSSNQDTLRDIKALNKASFPVINPEVEKEMCDYILQAKRNQDSVGGIIQTAIVGVPAGVGEPWFDTIESMLAHALFSIGGIKGVDFGAGFGFSTMLGSQANDAMTIQDGNIVTTTNNNGGINGGITNGMPIVFQCAVKPTPSIAREQQTVNFIEGTEETLKIQGRHDPAIIRRVCPVVDCICAMVIADFLSVRFGTDCLARPNLIKKIIEKDMQGAKKRAQNKRVAKQMVSKVILTQKKKEEVIEPASKLEPQRTTSVTPSIIMQNNQSDPSSIKEGILSSNNTSTSPNQSNPITPIDTSQPSTSAPVSTPINNTNKQTQIDSSEKPSNDPQLVSPGTSQIPAQTTKTSPASQSPLRSTEAQIPGAQKQEETRKKSSSMGRVSRQIAGAIEVDTTRPFTPEEVQRLRQAASRPLQPRRAMPSQNTQGNRQMSGFSSNGSKPQQQTHHPANSYNRVTPQSKPNSSRIPNNTKNNNSQNR